MSRGHVFLFCFVLFIVIFPKQFPESVWKAIVQGSPPPSSLPSHPPPSLGAVLTPGAVYLDTLKGPI